MRLASHPFGFLSGSMAAGHLKSSYDFFMTSKEHLNHVFDTTDYSVAQALLPMAFVEEFFLDSAAKGTIHSSFVLRATPQY